MTSFASSADAKNLPVGVRLEYLRGQFLKQHLITSADSSSVEKLTFGDVAAVLRKVFPPELISERYSHLRVFGSDAIGDATIYLLASPEDNFVRALDAIAHQCISGAQEFLLFDALLCSSEEAEIAREGVSQRFCFLSPWRTAHAVHCQQTIQALYHLLLHNSSAAAPFELLVTESDVRELLNAAQQSAQEAVNLLTQATKYSAVSSISLTSSLSSLSLISSTSSTFSVNSSSSPRSPVSDTSALSENALNSVQNALAEASKRLLLRTLDNIIERPSSATSIATPSTQSSSSSSSLHWTLVRARVLQVLGRVQEAVDSCLHLLNHLSSGGGGGGAHLYELLRQLALLLRERGQYAQAQGIYSSLLQQLTSLGDVPDQQLLRLQLLNDQATIFVAQQRFAEGQAVLTEVISVAQSHLSSASAENHTNRVETSSSDSGSSERAYSEVLLLALLNLAQAYRTQRAHTLALQLFKQAEPLAQQLYRNPQHSVLQSIRSYIDNSTQRQQIESLQQHLAPYFERDRDQQYVHRGDVAKALYQLGMLQKNVEDFVSAADTLGQCYEEAQDTLGEAHQITSSALQHRGVCLVKIGELSRADPVLVQCLALRSQHLGEAHNSTANACMYLAELRQKQGRFEEALQLLLRCLEARKGAQLPLTHNDVLVTLDRLAEVYYHGLGRVEDAIQTAALCLLHTSAAYGDEHPQSLMRLRLLQTYQGQL